MRNLSMVAALVVLATGASAQKVDLDRFIFTATYRGLPNKPLNPEYRTYSFNITSTASLRNNVTDDQVMNGLAIDGWKKVDGNGHIVINVNMEDVAIENSELKSREEEVKDKDGKVTGKKTYYYAQAIYSWAGGASVNDYKGNPVISSYGFASRQNKMTWNSSEFNSSSEAANYFNNNKYEIRNKLTQDLVKNALASLRNQMNVNYGYRTVRDQDFLWIMDSKKHPENEAQRQHWTIFKESIKVMNEKDSLADVKAKLAPAIAYFDGIKTKVTGEDKNEKKLRYSAYYCLAKIYLLLDQPDLAIKEAEGLIANEYDEKDGKRLKQEAEDLKKLFELNNTTTRHFDINVAAFEPPAK